MSEKAPNSRRDNFEAKKAAAEQEAFEAALYGDAGTTDFSDEAEARVNEAADYEEHMRKLTERSNLDPTSAEAGKQRRSEFINTLDDLNSQETRIDPMVEEAYAENDARNDEKEAELATRDAKIAADPKLRRMNNLAHEIAELRGAKLDVDPEKAEKQIARVGVREDALNELLAQYEASEDFDGAIADQLMNLTEAVAATESKDDSAKSKTTTPETTDEKAEDADPLDELDKVEGAKPIDVNGKTDKEDDPLKKLDDVEGVKPIPVGDETKTDSKPKNPLDDLDKTKIIDPIDLPPAEDDTNKSWLERQKEKLWSKEAEKGEDLPFLKRQYNKVYNMFFNRKPGEKKVPTDVNGEFLEKKDRRVTPTVVAIGAVGILAALAAYRYGVFGGGSGGNVDPNTLPGANGGNGSFPPEAPQGTGGVAHPEVFSEAAHTAGNGEGWINQLGEMGVTKPEIPGLLKDLLTSTDEGVRQWVYTMQDGNPGISHPGQIPQNVLESIQNFRNK